jgi:hypothetical protein
MIITGGQFDTELHFELRKSEKRHTSCSVKDRIRTIEESRAVPWLRRLVAGLSPRSPVFAPRSVHVGFVVDKVALGQVFLRVLRFSPVSIVPP